MLASRRRLNIDSPAKSPPIATPYRPPASSPSRHASTECAQPSSCSREYAAAMSGSIQAPWRDGSAQPATTSANAVSTRISKCFADWRIDRVTRSRSSGRMPRSTGDHHAIASAISGSRIGNSPCR